MALPNPFQLLLYVWVFSTPLPNALWVVFHLLPLKHRPDLAEGHQGADEEQQQLLRGSTGVVPGW